MKCLGDDRLLDCAGREIPLEEIIRSVQLFCGDQRLDDDCTVVDLAFIGVGEHSPGESVAAPV